MIAVPPLRTEFGLRIRFHVPRVAALPCPKVVVIEPGLEALYPDAGWMFDDPPPDTERMDRYTKHPEHVAHWESRLRSMYPGCSIVKPERDSPMPRRRFIPEPRIPQGVRPCDVVVCPRWREHAPERNWDAWPEVVARLRDEGLMVFAAGIREMSDVRVRADDCSWNYERGLDASIAAMLSAAVVVATDAGLAHLAVLCGRPLLLVGYGGGYPAPGLPTGLGGRVLKPKYWKIRMEDYFEAANHRAVPIWMEPNGWEDPTRVVAATLELMRYAEVA